MNIVITNGHVRVGLVDQLNEGLTELIVDFRQIILLDDRKFKRKNICRNPCVSLTKASMVIERLAQFSDRRE